MGTIADKLSYLSDIKEAIRTAIINKGVDVPTSDTFMSYADKISQISGGSFNLGMTNIIADTTSTDPLNITHTVTVPGLYACLFATATNNGGDQGYISYSGSDGDNYNLIHSYRASNASPADIHPTIAIDFVEIVSATDVTMFTYKQGTGKTAYGIVKFEGISSFGNIVYENMWRTDLTNNTVNISGLTITTDNILIITIGAGKDDNSGYSYASLHNGTKEFSFNPYISQMGQTGYNDGFMMLVPKNQITSVTTHNQYDASKTILIAEVN